MRDRKKITISTVLFIIMAVISYVLYVNKLYSYLIISGTLTLVLLVITVSVLVKRQDERSKYESALKSMLKKFDSILAETSTIPDLEGKNIMLITNIEDMIDASVEIRKPIYYKKEENDCIFSLLDNQDICIYILKLDDEVEAPIEKFIKNRKQVIENLIEDAKDTREVNDIINAKTKKKKRKSKEKDIEYL